MMFLNSGDIRERMEVFALDGIKLGEVGDVWPPVSGEVRISASPDEEWIESMPGSLTADGYSEPHMIVSERVRRESGNEKPGYFLVVSPEAGADLCVPFEAVQVLFPGQNVMLAYSAAECRGMFSKQPAHLKTDGPAE